MLAAELAHRLRIPHIELDALFWEPDWVEAEPDVFRDRVTLAVSTEAWVADGNYSRARDLVWTRAETIVWLDYPLWLVLWRTFRRSIRRIASHEDFWSSGNRETVRNTFFSKDSLLLWQLSHHRPRRRRYAELLSPHGTQVHVVRLRSPDELDAWLNSQNL